MPTRDFRERQLVQAKATRRLLYAGGATPSSFDISSLRIRAAVLSCSSMSLSLLDSTDSGTLTEVGLVEATKLWSRPVQIGARKPATLWPSLKKLVAKLPFAAEAHLPKLPCHYPCSSRLERFDGIGSRQRLGFPAHLDNTSRPPYLMTPAEDEAK